MQTKYSAVFVYDNILFHKRYDMRVNSVQTYSNYNNQKFTGSVNYKEVNQFITKLPNRLIKYVSASGDELIKTGNLADRLTAKMEKYSDSTVLNFRMKDRNEYEVFLENPFSNYKHLLPSLKFSDADNALVDLDAYEQMVKNVENTNQFEVELRFTQMRHDYVPRDEFKPKL